MNNILLSGLCLLAALCCAAGALQAAPAKGEVTQEEKEAYMRAEYHNPLNARVIFIHDKASADAAAPFVNALLASPEGKGLKLPSYTLITCYSYDFYDSSALREALAPVLPKEPDALDKLNHVLAEGIGHLDAVTAALEEVHDAESAKQAIAALELRLPAAGKAFVRASSVATDCPGPCAFVAHGRPMRAFDRLLHAYGHALDRLQHPCPELTEALVSTLREHLEHTLFYDPQEITPEANHRHEAQAAALHEWFFVASTIHDKASADAAAGWMEGKNAQLGTKLNSVPHSRIIADSPCLSLLEEAEANIYLYLANASPAYFGSEKLAALYAHDEEGHEPQEGEGAKEPTP